MKGEPLQVYCLRLRIVALDPIVLPPATSKLAKSILVQASPSWRTLLETPGPRRARVSMLHAGDKPLYQRHPQHQPLTAPPGAAYTVEACAVAPPETIARLAEETPEGVHETPYNNARVHVEPLEATIEDLDRLTLGAPTAKLRVEFRTPVIISNRLLCTPRLCKQGRPPRMHRLLPTPGLLAAALHQLWEKTTGQPPPCTRTQVARVAELYMAELDYNLKPETVVIGRDDRGNLRLARGYRGWTIYRVTSRRLATLLDRWLALATRLGLGRSRGIGLGETRAQWTT